jgi:hypothetical protein
MGCETVHLGTVKGMINRGQIVNIHLKDGSVIPTVKLVKAEKQSNGYLLSYVPLGSHDTCQLTSKDIDYVLEQMNILPFFCLGVAK